MVGRGWIGAFVFTAVVATALLPERTVVHSSAHNIVSTTYDTSLAPMVMFSLVAATCAYAGVLIRRPAVPPSSISFDRAIEALADSALGRTVLAVGALVASWPGVIAVAVGLTLRALATRR
jgi:hypothetical protein